MYSTWRKTSSAKTFWPKRNVYDVFSFRYWWTKERFRIWIKDDVYKEKLQAYEGKPSYVKRSIPVGKIILQSIICSAHLRAYQEKWLKSGAPQSKILNWNQMFTTNPKKEPYHLYLLFSRLAHKTCIPTKKIMYTYCSLTSNSLLTKPVTL